VYCWLVTVTVVGNFMCVQWHGHSIQYLVEVGNIHCDDGLIWIELDASYMITWGVDTVVIDTIHWPIHLFRVPSSIRWPQYLLYIPTSHLVNLTLQPASCNLTTDMSDCLIVRRMWHLLDPLGNCGRSRLPASVDDIVSPLSCITIIGAPTNCGSQILSELNILIIAVL
jgi:hypothetical protein